MNTEQKRHAIKLKVAEKLPDIATFYTTGFLKSCKHITALDILQTLNGWHAMYSDGNIYTGGEKVLTLNLSQTLDQWDESTINKLYELFYE